MTDPNVGGMFHGGFNMIRKTLLGAGILGSALFLTGCMTPYVSGSVGTRVGNGGYISGSVGGYPYGYGGYRGYNGYGYGTGRVYGYDRYGRAIYRLPDGRLVTGSSYGYNGSYYGYPGGGYGYPSYGYPGGGYYGYPAYGYPGYRTPSRPYRPPVVRPRPHDKGVGPRPGGDSGVPARPITRRDSGGTSGGNVLRQARERVRNTTPVEP